MNQVEKDELARLMVELIREDRIVRRAVIHAALSCPNIVREV